MNIGILTSGGDSPGLNAVIRAIVLKGIKFYKLNFVGFLEGWRGIIEKKYIYLSRKSVRGISKQGGTILGTSRTNPFRVNNGLSLINKCLKHLDIHAIIVIGGEGSLAAAQRLNKMAINIVGVPKTIDNDLDGTDYTFGFDTAVQIATEAIDRLRTTGESHHRCMIAEVMGRHVGWIALHAGIASGAHAILIPEQCISMKQVGTWLNEAKLRGRAPLVVVAEGFLNKQKKYSFSEIDTHKFGRPKLGGIAEKIAPEIEHMIGLETRTAILGHIQRGGVPSAYDRVLATRLGMAAIDAVMNNFWGKMVAIKGTKIECLDFDQALGKLKTVPKERYEEAVSLFG